MLIGFFLGLLQAGLPPGVLNVVSGFGPTAGAALCSHMEVDKVLYDINYESSYLGIGTLM